MTDDYIFAVEHTFSKLWETSFPFETRIQLDAIKMPHTQIGTRKQTNNVHGFVGLGKIGGFVGEWARWIGEDRWYLGLGSSDCGGFGVFGHRV